MMNAKSNHNRISSDSDDDSDSSDSVIIRRVKRSANIIDSDDEDQGFKGSSSQWETDNEEQSTSQNMPQSLTKKDEKDFDSDSSDGQSEKCPICLLPIRNQELGSPESCDHLFCVECILEWSKNMNTCPVDRQEYHLILVRKKLNGRIVRQIPVEKPPPPQEPEDNQTFCEICGSGDREDRLLLCDGCDLGFHLECLTPPLQEVPLGSWYCNECDPEEAIDRELDFMEIHMLLEDQEVAVTPRNYRRSSRRNLTRLIPRTQQSERVITRIMNNRSNREEAQEQIEEPSSSTQQTRVKRTYRKRKNKSSKRPRKAPKKSSRKYKTIYEIDEDTGEITTRKKAIRYKRKRKTRTPRRNGQNQVRPPKTVKKRLAQQLGICPLKMPAQSLPDVRIPSNSSGISTQRYQAGIPTLHLFGQRDDLDYFSGSDDETGGADYLVRRRPNHSDVAHFRRVARRKGMMMSPPAAVSSTSDILGSILDSQSKLYSKSTKFSVDNSGKFQMENKKENTNNNVNLKDFNNLAKQTPYAGNNRNSNGRGNRPSYSNNTSYQGSSYYAYDNFIPSSTSENYMSFSNSPGDASGSGNYDQDMPQDYTQSTLSSYDRDIDFENPRRQEEQQGQGEDSDIDIYSDIEDSVSTSKVEEDATTSPLNLAPAVVPNLVPNNGSDIDNENDSDNDMVIDTDKVEPPVQEVTKEDYAVTSSEDTLLKSTSMSDACSVPHSTSETESGVMQSILEKSKEDAEDDEDAFSEDGCPNFSIYSTESINLAKNTDVNADSKVDDSNQEVVSSTPVTEPSTAPVEETAVYDPEDAYDVYDPAYSGETCSDPYDPAVGSEKGSDAPEPDSDVEDAYDPERVYDTPEDTYDPEKTFDIDEDSQEKIDNAVGDTADSEKSADVVASVQSEVPSEQAEVPVEQVEVALENPLVQIESGPSVVESTELEVRKPKKVNLNVLYSDSEDEEVVKISTNSFAVGDINTMTEDVSEEERSYTPCLDEKNSAEKGKGPDGLDTEMISDDEKNNDFDESLEQKAASEGDALEINAKEFEMDLIRPEDYEEGEIVDKNKGNKDVQQEESSKDPNDKEPPESVTVETQKDKDKNDNKENEPRDKQQSFKKLSKNNKERNYRDKDRSKSRERRDKEKDRRGNTKEKRKDKRKEIERYDVRALIAEKPRRIKDKFGRDVRKSSSKSKSRSRSRSYTPKRSPIRRTTPKRLSSTSRKLKNKKRGGSSRRKSASKSRSRTRERKRTVSRSRRRRSRSRSKRKRRPSKDRSKRRKRARSSSRPNTPNRKRRKDWEERYSRDRGYSADGRWTPSLSGTPEAEPPRHMSPSWTPPRVMESAAVDPRGLTVILQNDQNKKKKEKKKRAGKKRESDRRGKRRRRDHTPPPSKEVFASGDNILVSVSFNKENETRERDVFTKKRKEIEEREKRKRSLRRKKKNQELSGIKPVAIIDLERSPFRELTPSPKDIIVLSDEEHVANSSIINDSQDICDSSQQVASPENVPVYMTGPKTPPEPQIKFSLPSKQQPLRPLLSNPLHDPEDEMEVDQETEDREVLDITEMHKGPNTPPEPPNSPPSSPDAYDPFEPTKSRSPSPDPVEVTVVEESEKRNTSDHLVEKNISIPSLTPPTADVQPADSQTSLQISRDPSKSPDHLGRTVQPSTGKAIIQTTPFTAGATTITSTPVASNPAQSRINILNSTILSNISSTLPQRIVLPNIKLSPVKISPVKNVIKSTPIKPMPNKNNTNSANVIKAKPKNTQQNGNDTSEVISLDFDSPYSPGSSDYEDLFEPPPEVVTKKTLNRTAPAAIKEAAGKVKNTFDALFGSPMKKMAGDKSRLKKPRAGTKIIGVKLDEDHLKILDELPNSAVEMQVKDKFLKKLNRQERVVEEVKLVLKPYYNKKKIDKEEYKDIMRRAVPKICHNKTGEINPTRIKNLVEAYVKKMRHAKPKVTSSSSYNPLKG